jgi:arginase
MNESKKVRILGVPIDMGAGRRGVDMGPSAIRYARLSSELSKLGLTCEDAGNFDVPIHERLTSENDPSNLNHLNDILDVCTRIRDQVEEIFKMNATPLVLGGDHSLSIGTLAAVGRNFERPAVLWIDAHGDFNTAETSPSGNIHGMSLAVSTGRGADELLALFDNNFISPHRAAIIGVRELDPEEQDLLREAGVNVYTIADIDRHGMQTVMQQALIRVGNQADALHVSFDLDVLNPDIAPGVGTPVEGGLSYREAHFMMEIIAESGLMRSLEVVELNPILDEKNHTGKLAVELIASALGKRIF